jgi:hypothetical protein
MVRLDATRQEIDDLMKYDGVYHKVTIRDIECGCFCSLGSCGKDFDTSGEIVIQTYSNLFHVKCFMKLYDIPPNIKKPSFDDNDIVTT